MRTLDLEVVTRSRDWSPLNLDAETLEDSVRCLEFPPQCSVGEKDVSDFVVASLDRTTSLAPIGADRGRRHDQPWGRPRRGGRDDAGRELRGTVGVIWRGGDGVGAVRYRRTENSPCLMSLMSGTGTPSRAAVVEMPSRR